ncbi:efflux RND transporter periplasmic adaptor subunit [Agrobacterium vaccinii]|uniref:efflux RND transporter periplasmic adaptor subunit n=1 Tax=Agrobacterium vaccinii TaxID=2735528 RepID=UPI000DD73F39|nr:efflux RND transporter periplasmic adaptor subunit [Agrobacterium vaccinii]UHS63498.1 efflux RND transporter periplasmic adaptor subunit [Agrobacterium vaccinii]
MRRYATIAFFAAALPGLAACSPEKQAQEKAPRHVEVVQVKSVDVSDAVSTTGEISARVQSDLSFRVSGQIVERLVDVGDHVTTGQVLARIDPQEQKADLQVALATLQSAQAQQTQAQQAFDRQQSLFNTGVTTRAALDQAQETLLTGQGTVQSSQAQVDTARDALEQTELKADADGIITARSAEVGQVAQAAQLVFTLAHDGPRDAVINADETTLLGGEIENDVVVRMLSGGAPIKATLRELSPALDTTTATIRVKLALDATANVRLGSPIVATAHYKPVKTMQLPWSAIASDSGQPSVWVVDPKTKVVSLRKIEVAKYANGHFSVKSGLSEGETVVVNGTKFLAIGETVAYEGAAQ